MKRFLIFLLMIGLSFSCFGETGIALRSDGLHVGYNGVFWTNTIGDGWTSTFDPVLDRLNPIESVGGVVVTSRSFNHPSYRIQVWEYLISQDPTITGTLVLDFAAGATNREAASCITTQGGVFLASYRHGNGDSPTQFDAAYRFPSGVWWTNVFDWSEELALLPPTYLACVQGTDGLIYIFRIRDSSHEVGLMRLSIGASSLTMVDVKTDFIDCQGLQPYYNALACPYGEFPLISCAKDPYNNRILIAYGRETVGSDPYGDEGSCGYWLTRIVVSSVYPDRSHYLVTTLPGWPERGASPPAGVVLFPQPTGVDALMVPFNLAICGFDLHYARYRYCDSVQTSTMLETGIEIFPSVSLDGYYLGPIRYDNGSYTGRYDLTPLSVCSTYPTQLRQFGSAIGAAKRKSPPSDDPYFGILKFIGSELTMNAADIAAVGGVVDKRSSSWKEVHGHNCPGLLSLDLFGNLLTVVDLSGNTSLASLNIAYNSLTSLNTIGLGSLTSLQCSDNTLTALNVTTMPNLILLSCENNLLTSLDLSGNPNLTSLAAYGMSIPTVDLSANTKLVYIDFGGNHMTPEGLDDVLIKLSNSGVSNGTAAFFRNGPATPAADVARTNLLNRGWTLQLDP